MRLCRTAQQRRGEHRGLAGDLCGHGEPSYRTALSHTLFQAPVEGFSSNSCMPNYSHRFFKRALIDVTGETYLECLNQYLFLLGRTGNLMLVGVA
jgi:hypothetical protein